MFAFISYSHKDSEALERLHVHLANLQREGLLSTWYDRDILAGDDLHDEIAAALQAANLYLLLISPDFIASDYCVDREMSRALERHQAGEARVVPIIVEPCDWASMPQLNRLKAVPDDGLPISEWTNPNTAYLIVVQELRRIIESEGQTIESNPDTAPQTNKPVNDAPRYRVRRDFDEIDRGDFRDQSFATIREYFRRAIQEIDAVEGLRGRFFERSATSFGSTIVNGAKKQGVAHITVYRGSPHASPGDIYYTFEENAAENKASGAFAVVSDDYDQFLEVIFTTGLLGSGQLSARGAAGLLWREFIEQAGVSYA